VCASLRPISPAPSFSVTANFVGKRNYISAEIKAALAAGIAQATGWSFTEDDAQAELNIRLFLEHATGYVGMRVGRWPRHRRPYKTAQLPGSLKPPVAAAMLWLAHARPGATVVDPCCGAGTILVEAALLGADACGGDVEPAAVAAAQANAAAAGVTVQARQWDARRLPLAAACADCVVCNLPWGRQVTVDRQLADFYREVCAEMRRVVKPGGRVVLLTRTPELVAFSDLRQEGDYEISLFGQNPHILVFKE
jgi:23S rRNA G2445 N2-methylase RlmL